MSKKLAPWIEEATAPLGNEVSRFVSPIEPELLEAAAEATSPLDAEVNRLLMSRAKTRPEPGFEWFGFEAPQLAMLGTAAAALLAVGTYAVMPPGYGAVGAPLGEVAEYHGETFELGPSIDVTADGTLRVAQADTAGTVIDLIDGTAEFSVDPGGMYRHLIIHAEDVEVEVKGTVFDVTVDDGDVWVNTTRGKVAVRYDGMETFVTADSGQWSSAAFALQLVEAEPGKRGVVASSTVSADPEAPVAEPDMVVRSVVDPMALATHTVDEGTDIEDTLVEDDVDVPEVKARTAVGDLVRYERRMRRDASPEEMLGLWDQFIEDHPDSPEIHQARFNRLIALAGLAPNKSTLREIDVFLARTPVERRPLLEDAHMLRVAIGQDMLGDCASVETSYDWLASNGDTKTTALASAWLGLCDGIDTQKAVYGLERAKALSVGDYDPSLSLQVDEALAAKQGTRVRGKRR